MGAEERPPGRKCEEFVEGLQHLGTYECSGDPEAEPFRGRGRMLP